MAVRRRCRAAQPAGRTTRNRDAAQAVETHGAHPETKPRASWAQGRRLSYPLRVVAEPGSQSSARDPVSIVVARWRKRNSEH